MNAASVGSPARRVFVVDDDTDLAETLAERLLELGYDAIAIDDPRRAARMLREDPWDALVTDLRMPQVDGLDLLGVAREVARERPVLVMTAFSAVESAIECIRRGAFHYFTKPFRTEELGLFLGRAFAAVDLAASRDALSAELSRSRSLPGLVGQSAALEPVWSVLSRVAETAVPVLLTGETGTGKTAVARAVHEESGRRGRFVTVSCSALPEALLESELFGHLRGAFTGATHARGGLFEEAQGGTLFLDEIGELAIGLQAKLLDVLERGVRRAVGSDRETKVDARVIAATHRDLRARVAEGSFREDLLYRLDVVSVELPPLRQRREDIPALVDRFIARARTKHPKTTATRCAPEALRWLVDNPWPGNVRELEHAVERGVLLAPGEEITREFLPRALESSTPAIASAAFAGDVMPMRTMQRRYAEWALERLEGRKMLACERLGLDPKTLKKLLAEGDEEELTPAGDGDWEEFPVASAGAIGHLVPFCGRSWQSRPSGPPARRWRGTCFVPARCIPPQPRVSSPCWSRLRQWLAPTRPRHATKTAHARRKRSRSTKLSAAPKPRARTSCSRASGSAASARRSRRSVPSGDRPSVRSPR